MKTPKALMGLAIVSAVFVLYMLGSLLWGVAQSPEPPPRLTDEQVATEVRRCNDMGLVLSLSFNRRWFNCVPPTTIQIR